MSGHKFSVDLEVTLSPKVWLMCSMNEYQARISVIT